MDLQEWFVRILNEELEKFNDFYVDKEEEFVIRLQVFFFLSFLFVGLTLFSDRLKLKGKRNCMPM